MNPSLWRRAIRAVASKLIGTLSSEISSGIVSRTGLIARPHTSRAFCDSLSRPGLLSVDMRLSGGNHYLAPLAPRVLQREHFHAGVDALASHYPRLQRQPRVRVRDRERGAVPVEAEPFGPHLVFNQTRGKCVETGSGRRKKSVTGSKLRGKTPVFWRS